MQSNLCSVCEKEPMLAVVAVPGVPCSMAYCRTCLEANAHPWGVLVANTACVGGMENAAPWWKEMVEATCKHLGKTLEQFNADVERSIRDMGAQEP